MHSLYYFLFSLYSLYNIILLNKLTKWWTRLVLLTVSDRGQTQVLHAVLHQLRQLLPFRASVQVESLLRDALCPAGRLGVLPAQSARPLHALLPQQRVLRLVTGGGVSVRCFLLPGLSSLAGLHALLCVDGQLRLGEQRSNVNAESVVDSSEAAVSCLSSPSEVPRFPFGIFL